MNADVQRESRAPIIFSNNEVQLVIEVDGAGIPRITGLSAQPGSGGGAGLPLVDVVLAGEGRAWSGQRYCESAIAPRLRYDGHEHSTGQDNTPWRQLRVDLADQVTGLRAQVFYRLLGETGVLRSWVVLANRGPAAVTVESVTSFLCGGPPEARGS